MPYSAFFKWYTLSFFPFLHNLKVFAHKPLLQNTHLEIRLDIQLIYLSLMVWSSLRVILTFLEWLAELHEQILHHNQHHVFVCNLLFVTSCLLSINTSLNVSLNLVNPFYSYSFLVLCPYRPYGKLLCIIFLNWVDLLFHGRYPFFFSNSFFKNILVHLSFHRYLQGFSFLRVFSMTRLNDWSSRWSRILAQCQYCVMRVSLVGYFRNSSA